MRTLVAAIALTSLTGCTTEPKRIDYTTTNVPASQAGGFECVGTGLDRYIGQRATAELGTEIRRVSGAEVLRWIPPRTAVTLEFRHDRVSVAYDDNYRITRVSCG